MAAERPVSEAALMVAMFVEDHRVFDDQAVWDLRRLLSHEVARFNPGRQRSDDLGLLLRVIARGDDPNAWVTEDIYDAANRDADGRWPSSSTLARIYGTWPRAVLAATKAWFGDSDVLKGQFRPRGWPSTGYSQREIAWAICRCAGDLGRWPAAPEFYDYGQAMRFRATVNPRLPGYATVRSSFGSFDAALRMAKELGE